jgi:integrase
MAVEQSWAWVICDEVNLHLLITCHHHHILHHARRRLPCNPGQLKTMPMQMNGMNIVTRVLHPNTMVIVAQCLGLRVSEIAALQWQDFDFERRQLFVQRSIVNGQVNDVKTEYSRDHVPLHEALVEVLLEWSKEPTPTEEGWVFASALTNKPYQTTEVQKRHLRPAGWCLVECPKCGVGSGVWCRQDRPTPNGARLPIHEERRVAAGKFSSIGWHTFRHTYRFWLDETGAPMKVQQELMRHASIQTTINVYGQAMTSSKREANGKVVEMVLKPVKASA